MKEARTNSNNEMLSTTDYILGRKKKLFACMYEVHISLKCDTAEMSKLSNFRGSRPFSSLPIKYMNVF